jgi:hypothetical protein
MKVIFLDIDGVLNSHESYERIGNGGMLGIDEIYLERFKRILEATGAKVVLSSTWRLHPDTRAEVRNAGIDFIDCTPSIPKSGGAESMERGEEVLDWLIRNPGVTDYAILDDDSDFMKWQHLFKTSWQHGLTEEVAEAVIKHLNHAT